MSENWGADLIPSTAGRINLLDALSTAQHLPLEAMQEAVRRPQAIADAVLQAAERVAAGEVADERGQNLLFWGCHVLAQVRDTRLFGPLLAILRRGDDAPFSLFGETAVITLPRVVASCFDGDADGLEAAIADRAVDEMLRWCLFGAYSFLVHEGRIARERARQFLVRFDDERLARAGDAAWGGWEEAIALGGFGDLAARRHAAVADARLLTEVEDADFAALLSLAESEPGNPARFAAHGLGYLGNAAEELNEALAPDEDAEPEEPIHNPLRHVGRNDPCPCGSGKKFKKCCLGEAA